MNKYLFSIAIVASCIAASCKTKTVVTTAPKVAATPALLAQGNKVYQTNCVGCHAAASYSDCKGPNLASMTLSTIKITKVINNGDGCMPSFKENLSAVDINAVAEYVHSIQR